MKSTEPVAITFTDPPELASWEHRESRTGFEVTSFRRQGRGWHIEGCTTAVEDGAAWVVNYSITTDETWATRSARISNISPSGRQSLALEADGSGNWWINGASGPNLTGTFDVDLESSAMTNTLPVHRLRLEPDIKTETSAVYVRALDLRVERLEQTYTRIRPATTSQSSSHSYAYTAPVFDFACQLDYDEHGLVTNYPGIARIS